MSRAMKVEQGLARAGLREWALRLVGGVWAGLGCQVDPEGLTARQPARASAVLGRTGDGKTDRSLDPWARRARSEARSRSCTWSNLEPLKES